MTLEFARRQTYEPATNVRGEDVDAWLFLLPRLDLERAVVIGPREDASARALKAFVPGIETCRRVSPTVEKAQLVYVTGGAARRLVRSQSERGALRRCLKAGGAVVLAPSAQAARLAQLLGDPAGEVAVEIGRLASDTARVHSPLDGAIWFIPARTERSGGKWRRLLRRLVASGSPPTLLAVRRVGEFSTGRRPRCVVVVRRDRHSPTSVPSYLADAAHTSGHDIDRERWIFEPSRGYRSQKMVFHLPDAGEIVKVTQDPAFNARLDNEYRALLALDVERRDGLAPRPRFRSHHAGLLILGQSRLVGEPFRARSTGTPTCPVAQRVIDALTELSQLGAQAPSRPDAASALHDLLDHHRRVHQPDAEQIRVLSDQIDAIGAAQALPSVFSHGDATTLNVLVGEDEEIGLFDWENAEPQGLPLWDVIHFANAYAQWNGERRGRRWTAGAIRAALYEPSGFDVFLARSIDRYSAAVGVPRDLVVPLTLTFWMALSLREATRRTGARRGPYAELLAHLVRDVNGIKLTAANAE